MSFAFWLKRYDVANSSAFWVDSPSQDRVFQAHVPWGNNTIYFDTAGCCTAADHRINAALDTFPDYGPAGEPSWWTNNWRFFVFSKKADFKQVWIDGKLFLEGNNVGVLQTDIGRLNIGADNNGGNLTHGLIDDYSIYSKALGEAARMRSEKINADRETQLAKSEAEAARSQAASESAARRLAENEAAALRRRAAKAEADAEAARQAKAASLIVAIIHLPSHYAVAGTACGTRPNWIRIAKRS